MRRVLQTLSLFAPLPVAVVGAVAAHTQGHSAIAFWPNLAAIAIGACVVVGLQRRALWLSGMTVPWLSVSVVAATLLFPGYQGVHRWLSLGAIQLHASAVWSPWVLSGLLHGTCTWRTAGAVLVLQAIHWLQPDAAQSTGTALATVAACGMAREGYPLVRWLVSLAVTVMCLGTWARDVALPAVPHVEGILQLVAACGVPWVALAGVAGLIVLMPFTARMRAPARFARTGVLLLLLLGEFVGALLGAYPVPLLGAGAGHVLGWYALYAVDLRTRQEPGTTGSGLRGR
ncbi:MAG: hypothetical protein OXU20_25280 [Myxococcales bacterium]|nr:hypothetical protein [Myxococcales bacterium]MDD9967352.1 hypothetical protein [Myxococcales bacterium]